MLVGLLVLLLAPAPAWADAPIGGEAETLPQGSIGSAPSGASSAHDDPARAWRGVQPLPPLTLPSAASPAPLRQDGGDGSSAIAWLDRQLNPGNWVLDAGMGIIAGVIKTLAGLLQRAALVLLGHSPPSATGITSAAGITSADASWSVIPAGCTDSATNIVFCVPPSLTYDHPGVQAVWQIVHGIAASLVTLLFVVRIGRLLGEGSRGLSTEGKRLTLTFILAIAFIQNTYPICQLLIMVFNGISTLLLAQASATLPATDVDNLNIGSNILVLVIWLLIFLLTLKSFGRLVQIIVLLAVAPLAGALLMDPATSPRFRAWSDKLFELLLAQINLAIIFIGLAAILQPYQNQGMGDAFVGFLVSIVMLGMALKGQSVIGIAGAALGGGNGLMSFLRYQVAGTVIRGISGGQGRSAGGQMTSGAAAPAAAAHRPTAPAGDPTRSAAAQRAPAGSTSSASASGSTAANGGTAARTPAPHGAFRYQDAGENFSSARATARAQAARSSRDASGRPTLTARRAEATARSTLMRERAAALRASGESEAATVMERKAQLHTRFGQGKDIARPARSAADRATRRTAYQQALGEVGGLHALERDQLTAQLASDDARAPVLQRELALAGATGGQTTALHAEHSALMERQAANRARLKALTPHAEGQPARVTREAAAALANERLPQRLRARTYALRHATDRASPFVRRLSGAATQGARDELARARATGARSAATPADARPPIAPPRRLSGAADRNRSTREARAAAPQTDTSSPASRAPSSTIERLRERRRQTQRPAEEDAE